MSAPPFTPATSAWQYGPESRIGRATPTVRLPRLPVRVCPGGEVDRQRWFRIAASRTREKRSYFIKLQYYSVIYESCHTNDRVMSCELHGPVARNFVPVLVSLVKLTVLSRTKETGEKQTQPAGKARS